MKKFAISAMIVIAALMLCYGSTAYSIKCYKCESYAESHHYERSCSGCPTWRMCSLETGENLVYKCAHGHTLYVNRKTSERK